MLNIEIPSSISYKDKKNNQTEVTITPCYPGYGVTLGNALRRVLLSSLPGAAVTHVKIKGVQHEFETMDHVKEDVVDIILNLKQLNLKLHSEEPVTLELSAKGEKTVTAADFKKNSDVEITNPEMEIATLTDKKAEFEMEITVGQGRGYQAVDAASKEKGEIGSIAVDALFSPVLNVGFDIEHTRVGQQTDYEKLIIHITTDGSLTAQEAVEQATKLLLEHFEFIKKGKSVKKAEEAKETEESEKPEAKEPKSKKTEEAEETEEKAEEPTAEEE